MAITRADIVAAALDVLDDGGIDAVTVRAVAGRLGVKAPALYWHVRNKQVLLDEMGTEIQRRIHAAAIPEVAAVSAWPDQLRAIANVTRREYLRHRDGARTFSGTRLTDPDVLRAQEPLLAALTRAGLPIERAVTAAELINAYVVGFVIEEQERRQSEVGRYDLEQRDTMVGEGHPLTNRAGHLIARDPDVRFAEHLDAIVAGVAGVEGAETRCR